MEAYRRVVSRFMNYLFTFSAALLGCSALLSFINAFCRKFLSFSFPWSEELSTYCVVIAVFLSIPFLELHDKQLCIGFLNSFIKNQKILKFFFVLRGAVTVVLTYIIVKFGITAIQAAIQAQTQTYVLRWPKSVLFAIAVFGLCAAIVSWITIFINKGDKLEC